MANSKQKQVKKPKGRVVVTKYRDSFQPPSTTQDVLHSISATFSDVIVMCKDLNMARERIRELAESEDYWLAIFDQLDAKIDAAKAVKVATKTSQYQDV